MMGIANSYTLEATFAGSTLGNRADTHFNTQDYEQMGKSFCQTLLDYYDDDPKKVSRSDMKLAFLIYLAYFFIVSCMLCCVLPIFRENY